MMHLLLDLQLVYNLKHSVSILTMIASSHFTLFLTGVAPLYGYRRASTTMLVFTFVVIIMGRRIILIGMEAGGEGFPCRHFCVMEVHTRKAFPLDCIGVPLLFLSLNMERSGVRGGEGMGGEGAAGLIRKPPPPLKQTL